MPIPPEELAAYVPPPQKPRKPKPEIPPLLAKLLAVIKAAGPVGSNFVYFIRCGEFVKIGQSQSPSYRVAALRTGIPYDLELLKVVRAGDKTERAIHAALHEYHHRFEWFRLEPDLSAAIKRLPGVRRSNYA
jgi:hypothetical protein